MRFDSIIWDWNGTLLNDVEVAINSINELLLDRNLKPLNLEHYLDVFTFPVQDYYEHIGFDLISEPFEIPAFQFIKIYNKAVETCGLHTEAIPILSRLHEMGYRQFILSAMEQQQLEKTVSDNQITQYFDGLFGLDNHFAMSKIEIGKSLISKNGLDVGRILMIGDTIHDYEVAQAIGCKCILVPNGHQSKERLLLSGANVVDNLEKIDFT